MEFVVLSPFPSHASGNVGDRLLLESTIDLIEEIHGPTDFHIHWRGEDFTSRLNYLNRMDGILLCGFEYTKIASNQYRIAENIDDVEPPIIPIGAIHRFFPGDERELARQRLDPSIRSFLNEIIRYCPDREVPVRTEWVGRVLRRNGFRTTLTGDPAWYDPEYIGERFHTPEAIEQLVFTTPHWSMYIDQAKELLNKLSKEFPTAERTVVLHAAPTDVDREISSFARTVGWDIHYASHKTEFIDMYQESDLHVGYRKHGHLAHLRWRRPSVVLAEDSRAQGLNDTLNTAGFPAFKPQEGFARQVGRISDSFPVIGLYFALEKYGYEDMIPHRRSLSAKPNPAVLDSTLNFVLEQKENEWEAFNHVQQKIDKTYEEGMQPFLKSALNSLHK